MRFARLLFVALLLGGCAQVTPGRVGTVDVSARTTATVVHLPPKCGPHHLRACTPAQRRFLHAWLAALHEQAVQRFLAAYSPWPHVVGGPWDCIAQAETSSNWQMVGSTYSTGLGVVNDIVYQYGTSREQHDLMSGTGTRDETIAVVARFTAIHGFGGWGVLTKEKCGLG